MLDLKRIREDPDATRAALARIGADGDLDELLRLDSRRRELLPEVEGLRAQRNEASDAIGLAKREGGNADEAIAQMREVSGRIKELEGELTDVETERDRIAATIPNPPHPDAPDGDTDEDAALIREVGERPSFDFEIRDHLEIGRALGLIETEKAAAASGSRFAYLMGDLVLVELALIRFAVEIVGAHGFTPVVPPVLVREEPLYGSGFFPGEREMIYEIEKDELFLVGTSEVSLAALHADEILEAEQLPIRYAGISTCFRREAGAAGKDTRGIFRVHQFDKVEMFSFVRPEDADARAPAPTRDRGGDPRQARDSLPRGRHRRRRSRRSRCPQVRLRGVDPEPGALPRAHLDLEHDRLPGTALELPVSRRRRFRPGAGQHPERDRNCRRPDAHRDHREPPAGGRQRRRAAGAGRSWRPGSPCRLSGSSGRPAKRS